VSFGRWRVTRWRPPGLQPVSLWNQPVDGVPLWQLVGTSAAEAFRQQAREDAVVARAFAAALASALTDLRRSLGFDSVFFAGGLAGLPGFALAFEQLRLPFDVVVDPEPLWAGCRGGRALLSTAGRAGGAVFDVGQTAIKGESRDARVLRPRDLATLPLRLIGSGGASAGAPTAPAAAFLADAIASLLARALPAEPILVLGLPCPIGDDLVPGACTYGWEGDTGLLPEVFRRLDAAGAPWPGARPEVLVVNDAELAAEAARASLPPGASALCVTLGFGPGGALLRSGRW
jgi:predicted NBD/HSP70 family sugar kinase